MSFIYINNYFKSLFKYILITYVPNYICSIKKGQSRGFFGQNRFLFKFSQIIFSPHNICTLHYFFIFSLFPTWFFFFSFFSFLLLISLTLPCIPSTTLILDILSSLEPPSINLFSGSHYVDNSPSIRGQLHRAKQPPLVGQTKGSSLLLFWPKARPVSAAI